MVSSFELKPHSVGIIRTALLWKDTVALLHISVVKIQSFVWEMVLWTVYSKICELGISRSCLCHKGSRDTLENKGPKAFLLLLTEWDSLQPDQLEVLCRILYRIFFICDLLYKLAARVLCFSEQLINAITCWPFIVIINKKNECTRYYLKQKLEIQLNLNKRSRIVSGVL